MSEDSKYVEHHIFARKKTPVVDEYLDGKDKLLASAASRGFLVTPGDVTNELREGEERAKQQLTEVNVEVVQGEADLILKDLEFWAKLALKYSLLELEYYKEGIARAIEWEVALLDDTKKRNAAVIKRYRAETESLSIGMILARAALEEELTGLRLRQIDAERAVLGKELELIEARIETAVERLKIIDATRRLIDIEHMILDAEERRAEALERVLAVERITAEMEKGLVPLYLEQADARLREAAATEESIIWQRALMELEFRRLALREAEHDAQLQELDADALLEQARADRDEAEATTRLLRQEIAAEIQLARMAITNQIITLKESMDVTKLDLNARVRWETAINDLEKRISMRYFDKDRRHEKAVAALEDLDEIGTLQIETAWQRQHQSVVDGSTRIIEQVLKAEEP